MLNRVTNFEEFKTLWSKNHSYKYYGNKPMTKEREQELQIEEMAKDFKRYELYTTQDGYFIAFDSKYTIDSVMYYDDEYDAPAVVFSNFKRYNDTNRKYYKLENCKQMTPYFIHSYSNDDKQISIVNRKYITDYESNLKYYRDKKYFVRFMTDEEVEEYNKIVEKLDLIYDERLEKYFKKYNKNITTHGYWANR